MKEKRGIAPVFQYIFVAIAGIIILSFFVQSALRQSNISKEVGNIQTVNALEDNLRALEVATNANKEIQLAAKQGITVNKPVCGVLRVENSPQIRTQEAIFSNTELKADKLKVWTVSWEYPYRIMNFFFLADGQTEYIVQGTGRLAEELVGIQRQREPYCDNFEFIPKIFNVKTNSYTPQSGQVKKYVFINQEPTVAPAPTPEVLKIQTDGEKCDEQGNREDSECTGVVTFYKEEGQETTVFFGKAMLYGSIFAKDKKSYDCSLEAAFERMEKVTKVYEKRAEKLFAKDMQDQLSPNPTYLRIKESLHTLITTLENKKIKVRQLTQADLQEIAQQKEIIQNLNEVLRSEGKGQVF